MGRRPMFFIDGNSKVNAPRVMSEREVIEEAERERIIALMVAWDGNKRVHNARGGFDADALREAFQKQ